MFKAKKKEKCENVYFSNKIYHNICRQNYWSDSNILHKDREKYKITLRLPEKDAPTESVYNVLWGEYSEGSKVKKS